MAFDQAGIEAAPPQPLAIVLANKLARVAWAVLARGREYQTMIMTRVTVLPGGSTGLNLPIKSLPSVTLLQRSTPDYYAAKFRST
jgi:hypothetical protein